MKQALTATLISLGAGNRAWVRDSWVVSDRLKKYPGASISTAFWVLFTAFVIFFFPGFGRPSMEPAAWGRQGCRWEQRQESGVWCHGRDTRRCMGCSHHYVREATGTSGTYFSVLWKCSGGLFLNQMSLNWKHFMSYRNPFHCIFTLLYMLMLIIHVNTC